MKNTIKFYDTIFKIIVISFVLVSLSLFIVPEEYLDKIPFLIPWYIFLITWIICEIIFIIGMIINAFKMKRYGWWVIIICLGPFFPSLGPFFPSFRVAMIFILIIYPIIFYFSIMRKELKKEVKAKTIKRTTS